MCRFFFGKNKRCHNAYGQYTQNNQQRITGSKPNLICIIASKHFKADKCQQYGQADLQVMELIDNIHQQEEHGPQAQDGKYIGEEYDIRVFGDRKNSRDRIDGKNKIGYFDDHQYQKQAG